MMHELEKTILRIVQDYCYKRNINNLVSEFSLTIASRIAKVVSNESLTHSKFESICNVRKDFYLANDLLNKKFLIDLYKEIKIELSYYVFNTLVDSLVEYKKRMENGNLKAFPKGTKEDTLRSNLSIYLQYENFCEPRCGSGNADIIIPSQKSIIETKLWKGEEYYNSGIPELKEYLIRQRYTKGFYIIYDYNKAPNSIIKNCGEIFEIRDKELIISVVFIRMNLIPPSKIYNDNKKQNSIKLLQKQGGKR